MPIRPANTVRIITRRLEQAESAAGVVEPMELVSLYDELARVERKWTEQLAAGSERRQPGDRDKLAGWYRRLRLVVERVLRDNSAADPPAAALLRQTLLNCSAKGGVA